MNTIRKLKKNAKALSPVVASIILIAVTVAVSIAVAAWMGALVVGNMSTEEVKITNVYFQTASPFNATLTVKNTGSSAVVISVAYIGTQTAVSDLGASGKTIQPNTVLTVQIAPPTAGFVAGQSYQFKLVSTKGNAFVYTVTKPL
jgi:flagellin-like protein